MKTCVVIGTRPDAIKMAPVIRELKSRGLECRVCSTGQHRELLDQALSAIQLVPDDDLRLMTVGQSLGHSASVMIKALEEYFSVHKPDLVLIHGDTTTAFAAAMAAFYSKIRVGHVEAGLRTWNMQLPWPEEAHRVIISRIANIHFAPTGQSVINLKAEGVNPDSIVLTGNTIVDAIKAITEDLRSNPSSWHELQAESMRPFAVVTCHRRESFGGGIASICLAIRNLAYQFKSVKFIFTAHPNPKVRETIDQFVFPENVLIMAPMDYREFMSFLSRSILVMTDSGGVQEEAVSLGKPLLILRDTTERHEAVDVGAAKLVGTDYRRISIEASEVLSKPFDKASSSIYGDGRASSGLSMQSLVPNRLAWPCLPERRVCVIDQPAGLGDILFIQKIIDRIISDGYHVDLPVVPAYHWLCKYITKPHLRIYPSWTPALKLEKPDIYLPFKESGNFYPHMPVISAKYQMLRMNYDGWQDHVVFNRFRHKEHQLFDRLRLHGKKYNLISKTLGSPPNHREINFTVNNGLPNVVIYVSDEFTPFDWATVIEQATNLFFVDSSFTFIVEKLKLNADGLYLISRAHDEGPGVHESLMTLNIFKKPWKVIPPGT